MSQKIPFLVPLKQNVALVAIFIVVLTSILIALQRAVSRNRKLADKVRSLEKSLKSFSYEQNNRPGNQEVTEAEFYAGIIDVPNLKSLNIGWDITIPKWNDYQRLAKHKGTLLTVVGNYAKGKTFLIELLSGMNSPHGFNVNTKGLSIVYLKDGQGEEKPVIALDTKGSGIPLDISSLRSENALSREDEAITELLRDHGATEDLLQNFIIEQASVIIVVIADLTFDDQKLVNKIKNKFQSEGTKKVVVVHNLYHTNYLTEVEDKIQNSILKSFSLDNNVYKDSIDRQNRTYYVDTSRGRIPHVILAKQNTEAGDYYNDTSIKYIREIINVDPNYQSVDIVKSFYEYLRRVLPSYIKSDPEANIDGLKLITDGNQKPESICWQGVENLKMKTVFADIFGDLHIFKEGHRPSYSIFKETTDDGTEFLCLKIECPDTCSDVEPELIHTYNDFHFQVKGKKENNNIEGITTITNNRYFGDFFVETDNILRSQYPLYSDYVPQKEYVDGMCILKWKMKPEVPKKTVC